VGTEEFRELAEMLRTELVVIDAGTTPEALQRELRWTAAYHRLAARL
jgi:L-arabinose isomerase